MSRTLTAGQRRRRNKIASRAIRAALMDTQEIQLMLRNLTIAVAALILAGSVGATTSGSVGGGASHNSSAASSGGGGSHSDTPAGLGRGGSLGSSGKSRGPTRSNSGATRGESGSRSVAGIGPSAGSAARAIALKPGVPHDERALGHWLPERKRTANRLDTGWARVAPCPDFQVQPVANAALCFGATKTALPKN